MSPTPSHPYGRSATDVRRRARREQYVRRQRMLSLIVLSALVIAVVVGAAWAWRTLQRPAVSEQEAAPAASAPAEATAGCPAPGSLPAAPDQVVVTVLNGTDVNGLAGSITEQLDARGFGTGQAANADPTQVPLLIQHGPDDYLAAMAVAAQFPDAQVEESEDLSGGAVTVTIGEGYPELVDEATATAALQEEVPMPEGCAGN